MATFHFELVSPERLVFAGEVSQVDVPGEEGEFGVLAGHAPYIAALRPGVLTIYGDDRPQRLVVRGGLAEMGPSGLTVLAEQAIPVEDIDAAMIAQAIKDAEEDIVLAKTETERARAVDTADALRTLRSVL